MRTILALCIALACVCWLAGCSSGDPVLDPNPTFTFSFENGLGDWIAKAYDTDVAGTDAVWAITGSTDRATQGTHAVKFSLDNNDAEAKMFMEQGFTLDPGTYTLSLDFDFASADFGTTGLWQFIASASKSAAANHDDLHFLGDTGNGKAVESGFVWVDKTFTGAQISGSTVTVAAGDKVYVQLGVSANSALERAYYLDNLTVKFTKN
jgi:hypothetical protein